MAENNGNGNTNNSYVNKATIIIAIFSILAKVLGLVRDAVFSNRFGTSTVMDSYFAAFRIPDFIFNLLILGTFSVAFIPVFSEYLIKDRKKAYELASSILNFTLFLILALTLFAFIFIEPLITIIAPGLHGEARELTKTFTKIFLLSPVFLTVSSIVSSILNAEKKFGLVAASPVVYNLSIIFGAIVFYPMFGPKGLAWGVVLGSALHLLVQIPQLLRTGFRYTRSLDYHDPLFIKFWKLYWPRIFSMGTSQVTLLIATFFGSFLGTGALSSFYYSNNLQSVFLSVFAVSFAMAVFPLLSDLFNKGDESSFKDVVAKTTNQILFFIIPLSTLMLVLRAQVVRLVLGIGAGTSFSFEDVRLVALSLGLFSVSLFAQALIPLYNRAFYARHNTVTPMVISMITIVINVVVTYFAVHMFGVPGMALAFSVTSILELVFLIMELHKRLDNMRDEYLLLNILKIVIASICGAIVTYVGLYAVAPLVNMQTYWGVLIQGGTSGIIGLAAYLLTAWLLKIDDSDHMIRLLKSVMVKAGKPFTLIFSFWN